MNIKKTVLIVVMLIGSSNGIFGAAAPGGVEKKESFSYLNLERAAMQGDIDLIREWLKDRKITLEIAMHLKHFLQKRKTWSGVGDIFEKRDKIAQLIDDHLQSIGGKETFVSTLKNAARDGDIDFIVTYFKNNKVTLEVALELERYLRNRHMWIGYGEDLFKNRDKVAQFIKNYIQNSGGKEAFVRLLKKEVKEGNRELIKEYIKEQRITPEIALELERYLRNRLFWAGYGPDVFKKRDEITQLVRDYIQHNKIRTKQPRKRMRKSPVRRNKAGRSGRRKVRVQARKKVTSPIKAMH